jgi:mitogen-activated protein kinase kinase kinase 7
MLRTPRALLAALALTLALPAPAAATDIIAQIRNKGVAVDELVVQPTLDEYPRLGDRVPSDAAFAALTSALQRAVLWDLGLVRLADTDDTYTQVYVRCPRSMNDIFLAVSALDTDVCPINDGCKQGVMAFAMASCDPEDVAKHTICAIAEDIETKEWYNATMWSKEPTDLNTYDPQLFAHDLSALGNETSMVYLIAQNDDDELGSVTTTGCLRSPTFVAPCRRITQSDITSAESVWCKPAPTLSLTFWQSYENGTSIDNSGSSGSTDGDSGVSIAIAVALGVVAGVLAVLALVFLVLWLRAKRRARSASMGHYVESTQPPVGSAGFVSGNHPSTNGTSTGNYNSGAAGRPSIPAAQVDAINDKYRQRSPVIAAFCADQELMLKHISFAGLVFRQKIASGANGEVWQGEHDGQPVAIKRVMQTAPGANNSKNGSKNGSSNASAGVVVDVDIKALEQFTKEIRIASTLEHDNIVRFVGLAWRTLPELSMVSEFMPGGDLAHCLASEQGKLLTWGDHKVALAFDIANALVYLHSLQPVIIHRDLKSLNVLLTESFNAKLSDFGLSRERDVEMTMTSGVGTLLWTAPEVLRGEKYSEKADIYSFGVVLSELDTCLPPYSLNEESHAHGVRSKSLHLLPLITKGQISPEFRPDCPPAVLELARACLQQDANARPRAMEIVYELRSKIWPSFL